MLLKAFLVTLMMHSFSAKLPNDVKQCKIDDNNCIVTSVNVIFRNHHKGNANLGLSTFDPLKIESMNLVRNEIDDVKIELKLKDVELLGFSNAEVYKFSGLKKDIDGNRLDVRFKTPLGTLVGPYSINGQLLILPIEGNGTLTLNLENLDVGIKFLLRKVVKDSQTYVHIDKVKLNYQVSRANVTLTNLFHGDEALGNKMNKFLNEN